MAAADQSVDVLIIRCREVHPPVPTYEEEGRKEQGGRNKEKERKEQGRNEEGTKRKRGDRRKKKTEEGERRVRQV